MPMTRWGTIGQNIDPVHHLRREVLRRSHPNWGLPAIHELVRVLQQDCHMPTQMGPPGVEAEATLQEKGPNLIDHGRAP